MAGQDNVGVLQILWGDEEEFHAAGPANIKMMPPRKDTSVGGWG